MKTAIITAAGSGSRFGSKKQFEKLNNKIVLDYSVEFFKELGFNIIVTVPQEDIEFVKKRYKFANIVQGSSERFYSVYNGLQLINEGIVLIHDAARPILDKEKVYKLLDIVYAKKAAILAIKCTDTLKFVENDFIKFTVKRDFIYCAQTPQGFDVKMLKKAYKMALKDKLVFSDEASLWEHYISSVAIVEGYRYNIKITTRQDLKLASCILNDFVL
ncbi:MAG: 2-C-methyl-D-erythritol 4-phosphate cytidylyltransferase [Desulfurella sp.]|jgi:2-C-methyl-D-erythritol 4-phosphate cytidylyltransferase|uniref:2-C-methyl-D-erythritol 4-phosphate cytidylyltransferase n=1 Tax=Desulfurella multipotens TaxID=79269 RepID=A0A1G6HZL8_9BACT|nr:MULTISPECIES: 2-C-methyl-D-erythritol 4-phosphate cytidylyltransferase [Desulfurella]AHF97411.1 2-C-methyl-D-erythritol 4-phosphate cytidylyltransferase [Desulfurella acetivorans A63]PMP65979.1 MAG: 2-C-methyl-D-erythritol 4-phosphate cytidylyltransferase [Desulfurella multipotens]PMP87213.1 MAG: 2-C-methyl-D-erythritol 4-phosphate cytidylyltransferase [Desulfurella sp.]SDB99598.1 2-C-methyl-D-erythritol 4-phosphate cytidylyltransferase [Desulfurella multipotens]